MRKRRTSRLQSCAAPRGAGDIWTSTAFDADNKLILSWKVGGRDPGYALELMDDVRERLANRMQLTTDGHSACLGAVEEAIDSPSPAIAAGISDGLWSLEHLVALINRREAIRTGALMVG